jgi:hypothetical protein
MNLDHGAGKGDAPRSKFDANWSNSFALIKWPVGRDAAFRRKGNKLVKVYSNIADAP